MLGSAGDVAADACGIQQIEMMLAFQKHPRYILGRDARKCNIPPALVHWHRRASHLTRCGGQGRAEVPNLQLFLETESKVAVDQRIATPNPLLRSHAVSGRGSNTHNQLPVAFPVNSHRESQVLALFKPTTSDSVSVCTQVCDGLHQEQRIDVLLSTFPPHSHSVSHRCLEEHRDRYRG